MMARCAGSPALPSPSCSPPVVAWFYGDARMVGITIGAGLPLFLGSLAACRSA